MTVKHGRVELRELVLGTPENVTVKEWQVVAAGRPVRAEQGRDDGGRLVLKLGEPVTLGKDQTLEVVLTW